MYKILLADNERVVLDALRNMIYKEYDESFDIRYATNSRYTRALARKFMPDIAIINIEMPGMHGFDVIKEIRSYHLKCVFITVSTYDRAAYRSEAGFLGIQAHLIKPLFREKVIPAVSRAIDIVSGSQKRQERNLQVQQKLDAVVPVLEHGFISQLFFDNHDSHTLEYYKQILDFPQSYGRIIRLSFGELPEDFPDPGDISYFNEHVFQNIVGSTVRMQRNDSLLRELIKEAFPLATIGPIMSGHVFFLLPYWKPEEPAKEKKELDRNLSGLLEILNHSFEVVGFVADISAIRKLEDIRLPDEF